MKEILGKISYNDFKRVVNFITTHLTTNDIFMDISKDDQWIYAATGPIDDGSRIKLRMKALFTEKNMEGRFEFKKEDLLEVLKVFRTNKKPLELIYDHEDLGLPSSNMIFKLADKEVSVKCTGTTIVKKQARRNSGYYAGQADGVLFNTMLGNAKAIPDRIPVKQGFGGELCITADQGQLRFASYDLKNYTVSEYSKDVDENLHLQMIVDKDTFKTMAKILNDLCGSAYDMTLYKNAIMFEYNDAQLLVEGSKKTTSKDIFIPKIDLSGRAVVFEEKDVNKIIKDIHDYAEGNGGKANSAFLGNKYMDILPDGKVLMDRSRQEKRVSVYKVMNLLNVYFFDGVDIVFKNEGLAFRKTINDEQVVILYAYDGTETSKEVEQFNVDDSRVAEQICEESEEIEH